MLKASEATVEFRSFPGDVLQRPLATLGWVRFCGALVTAACAGAPLPDVGDEAALLRFAGLRDDAMMGAWWRECANRVRPAELELETVITSFAERFDTWLAAARRASIESAENDDAALVAACDEWRSVFAATASLRQMVPPDDARVWGRVQRAQEEAREFIQLLGNTTAGAPGSVPRRPHGAVRVCVAVRSHDDPPPVLRRGLCPGMCQTSGPCEPPSRRRAGRTC